MLFNSTEFIFAFLPLAVLGFFAIGRLVGRRSAKLWLVLASLFFYGYWNPKYLLLIVGSTSFNYVLARYIESAAASRRRKLLVLGLLANLAPLVWFKYSAFFAENINLVTGLEIPVVRFELPLAISFFTFQQIAYLVDSYWEEKCERSAVDYSLFVTFFPQLIAGPIVRHSSILPQFHGERSPLWSTMPQGLFLFALGLFKKTIIADTFAKWADAGFPMAEQLTSADAWGASLSWTFQIYYDFSGYSDMAIGLALLFGITLPVNFNSPYQAVSIPDFWKRWHITLSLWFRDYVYVQLATTRDAKGKLRSRPYYALLITWAATGLWHGAAWTFVFWGSLHGVGIIVARLWKAKKLSLPKLASWLMTFLFVHVTNVLFRAESTSNAASMLGSMVGIGGGTNEIPGKGAAFWEISNVSSLVGQTTDPGMWLWCVIFAAVAFLAPNGLKMVGIIDDPQSRLRFQRARPLWLATAVLGALGITSLLADTGTVFLYFNF